jgi:glutathione S-transferase
LLTFNSIIEASRLGAQAAAILAIANCIKQISEDWGQIADQSGSALQEVLGMVKQTNDLMGAFSGAGQERLREAQKQTWAGLETLRDAAVFAARQAQEMKAATEQMQAKTTAVGNTVDLLDACFGRIDEVLTNLEGVRHQIDIDCPQVKDGYDAAEAERLFSASYTTEMERDVLRAALSGAELPVAQQTFAGNSVELF